MPETQRNCSYPGSREGHLVGHFYASLGVGALWVLMVSETCGLPA